MQLIRTIPNAHEPEINVEMVGRGGVEPPTSRLSGVRSNHLSYRPLVTANADQKVGLANEGRETKTA